MLMAFLAALESFVALHANDSLAAAAAAAALSDSIAVRARFQAAELRASLLHRRMHHQADA
jgi:hypothetical protein